MHTQRLAGQVGLLQGSERVVDLEMELEETQDQYRLLLQNMNFGTQQRKMAVIERRLEQLMGVQHRLIEQNTALKRDVAIAEKRLVSRAGIIEDLEWRLDAQKANEEWDTSAEAHARIAKPLGLDFHVGLADSEFDRVAHIARGKGNLGDAAAQRLLKVMMSDAQAMSTRSFTNPPSIMTSTNKPEWRRMQQPAANGHGNARSLAGFYAGLLDGSLLDAELLGEMTREHSVGDDKTLLTRTRFGLGCMLDQADVANATYGMGAKAFGHPGAGGSSGFADPERDLAFGFVTNNLGPFVLMDPRAQKLARQIADCI